MDYAEAGGVLVASLAALVAIEQLRAAKAVARSQLILSIDQSLAPHEDVRARINRPSDWRPRTREEKVAFRRYAAALGRLGHLIDQRQLFTKTVDRFYGERFAKLVFSGDGENIRDLITREHSWDGFKSLYGRLQAHRNLPAPFWKPEQPQPQAHLRAEKDEICLSRPHLPFSRRGWLFPLTWRPRTEAKPGPQRLGHRLTTSQRRAPN
jgi:hypothetical protein